MEAVIRAAITDALKELGLPEAAFTIEHPKILDHGDYACNVAMVLGKQVGQAPRAIADNSLRSSMVKLNMSSEWKSLVPAF